MSFVVNTMIIITVFLWILSQYFHWSSSRWSTCITITVVILCFLRCTKTLFIIPGHPLMQYTYTANFNIYNIGRYTLYFQYQQNEFSVAASSRVFSRSIRTVGRSQPAPIKLFVRRDGDMTRYFVLDIMPTIEGAQFNIVIGSNCKCNSNFLRSKCLFYERNLYSTVRYIY